MATRERASNRTGSSTTSSDRVGRVLRGLRVIDLANDVPGRYCARLLGDAGAEVIRVIANGRAERRPALATERALQRYVDRGKVRAHYSTEADLESLFSTADVVVHDSLYGDSPWTLDFPALRDRHSGLISVSITPFGESGPRAGWKSDDLIAVSSGGLAHATPGLPDFSRDLDEEPPLRPDALVGELMSGLHGAVGAMLALFARNQDGRGQHVEVSMQEVVAALMPWDINLWTFGKTIVGRREVRAHLAPNSYLPGTDNWFVIVAFTEAHWQSLLEIMGNPDWADNELFASGIARGENSDALEPLLVDWLKTQPPWKFLEEVQKRGVPSTPALELADALENDHIRSRSFLVKTALEGHGERWLPGDVFIMNGRRRDVQADLGEASLESLGKDRSPRTVQVPSSSGRLPLEGVRIVDFSQFVAMPLTGRWLALMGADVLLIESQISLLSRRWAPFAGEPSPDTCGLFINLNLGKKSVTINLRTPEGVNLAKQLIRQADLVLENFSPGTMQKLGLGYEDLRRIKDDISMISLPAFGSTGPWRNYVAFHSGVAALSGFAAVTGYEGSHPRIVGAVTPDTIAASYCLLAALQALHHQRRTGEGFHIEIAMSETLQSLMPEAIAAYGLAGQTERRLGNRHRWKAPHGIYRCQGDDAWVAISVANNKQWRGLCEVLGQPRLAEDEECSTSEKRKRIEHTLDALVTEWAQDLTPDEAATRLQQAGVPASKVLNARDLVEDPHLLERGAVVTVTHPKAGSHPVIGVPWRLHLSPPVVYRHAPLVGDGNDYAFRNLLGLTDAEIANLVERQVIY